MKTKPIIIIVCVLIVAACSFLFVKAKYLVKPEEKEVIAFLDEFNADVKQGFTDTLLTYFDNNQNHKQIIKLLGLLTNKTGLNGKDTVLFYAKMFTDDAIVNVVNNELTTAVVPVILNEQKANNAQSTNITIKLRKLSPGHFKIIQIDARQFIKDYIAYDTAIKQRMRERNDGEENVTYSPQTLEAFKKAEQLKTRYDSVPWFAHIDKKTYYYVVKGKWQDGGTYPAEKVEKDAYKMGLLDPDLKELIPVEYDMIHTIGATIPDMIEVEKDDKKGLYDMTGKMTVPVTYDQIFAIDDDANLAVLQNGKDYFYLKKDMTVSDKVDLKFANFFGKIRFMSGAYDLFKKVAEMPVVTEHNSRERHGAIYIPPSYLSYLGVTGRSLDFKNPLRTMKYEEAHTQYDVSQTDVKSDNWFSVTFYSIRDHFLGGRSEFYDSQNIVIVDKKNNRVFSQGLTTSYGDEMSDGSYEGKCDVSGVKMINDSLIEVRAAASMNLQLYDSTKLISGGVFYHYLVIRDNKLTELPDKRMFGFTRYVKMDDSYLNGCYDLVTGAQNYDSRKKSQINQLTPEILRYMKNEIYASYRFQFKDKRWQSVFEEMTMDYDREKHTNKPLNVSVDDSLTAIDKYNINWITNKLKKAKQPQTLAALK